MDATKDTVSHIWLAAIRCSRPGIRSAALVQAYTATEGFWHTDRQQRLVEPGAAACAANEEVARRILFVLPDKIELSVPTFLFYGRPVSQNMNCMRLVYRIS